MVRKRIPFITATAAIALLSGFVFGCRDTTEIATVQITDAISAPAAATPLFIQATEQPSQSWTEPETEPEPREKLLQTAELDAETQWSIYAECGNNAQLFCTVMAIANHETGYDTNAIGDGGNSIGMMQINTPWHTERLADLGITDLTDPVQSAKVAVSILQGLTDTYGYETASHSQLMAYNMGAKGARKAMDGGYSSTEYSREVMRIYQGYLEEMEVQEDVEN